MTKERREGGCLCGAIRYSAEWPPMMVATCSCRNCQKQAGSALSVIAMVSQSAMELSGTLSTYEDKGESGDAVFRKFCGKCGSPIMTEVPSASAQGIVIIKVGTLDNSNDVQPTLHYWTCYAPSWMVLPEGGTKLEKQ
jgi:hypothetical protein